MSEKKNLFGARQLFDTGSGQAYLYRLDKLEQDGLGQISRLPFSIKVLLESALRNCDDYVVPKSAIERLAAYDPANPVAEEIPFLPARVILQDFTGVPCVVDLAAMRSAMQRLGGNPDVINPRVPVDLVIDHSVQVDEYGSEAAMLINSQLEFERNRERYEFLRWGQQALDNFGVVPPARGIVHQINLEYLAKAVWKRPEENGIDVIYPDSLVGTDSHTTMINGLGIVGWGVGGIEAEAVMLGQPIYMLIPQVIGFKLEGKLREGVTPTDLTLTITQMLRKKGVVDKFVEFYGPGISSIGLADRAMIANMAPEYGATIGFFPIDDEALSYLRRTGRDEALVTMVERYNKEQGLFRTDDTPDPVFTDTLSLNLDDVVPSVAGPKRPQDRIFVPEVGKAFQAALTAPIGPAGFGTAAEKSAATSTYDDGKQQLTMKHGDVVIAAITSCTNTSNPFVLMGAGLIAKKAVERGLKVKPYVKTSLAPGSRVVTEYLREAGLLPYLNQIGFNVVGYGCTTCIGNSGPLREPVNKAITDGDLVVAGVLSGNRNFEGRVHPLVKANYLASPMLVVSYALAGTVDLDLMNDPIGANDLGETIYLKDLWPTAAEVNELVEKYVTASMFLKEYNGVETSNEDWNAIPVAEGALYEWNDASTYVQEPPFFTTLTRDVSAIQSIHGAKVLLKLGDSVTTDHISPAGSFKKDTPAGTYLLANGIEPKDFNSYGSRRGAHEVMMRGTFANIRIRNQVAPGTEGGWTTYFPTGDVTSVYDASMKYQDAGTPLVVLGGKDYGMGSSRDWAAKGTMLLGVKAVIAESFERIHRSNLVGMGVLPLVYKAGESAETLGLDGTETFDIPVTDDVTPRQEITVTATKADGMQVQFQAICRLDTPIDVDYYRNGGILNYVLREFLNQASVAA
ncbi:MAG: aconitate hydratase AcnA [Rhodothermia bacterium]|nr:aconitate hydratase AcnA [Rhodothermia bacterium]